MIKNEDLLKDSVETGEEGYTENVERTCAGHCCKGGIQLLRKESEDVN